MAPLRKVELFLIFFCCLKRLHLCKWHQNSASRGAELWTSKRLLKRSRFGSSFFLSAEFTRLLVPGKIADVELA